MIDITALQTHIRQLICQLEPDKKGFYKLIVGFSGGADSLFLLYQLTELQKSMPLELIAAHLEHDWRGKADKDDADFCRILSKKLNVLFVTKKSHDITISKKWNGSLEEIGRHQRHTFLEEIRKEYTASGILLGHQAQDQEENFFIRLLRGSSLKGLCGMQAKDGFIMRPLLGVERKDIEFWLLEKGHQWCHDVDNDNSRFLRNRIRHELLPILGKIDPRFGQTFTRTLLQLSQEQELIDQLTKNTFDSIFDVEQHGDLIQFKNLHPMLQGHVLKKLFISAQFQFTLSESFINEALRFLNSPRGGSHQLNQAWVIRKKGPRFWITLLSDRIKTTK